MKNGDFDIERPGVLEAYLRRSDLLEPGETCQVFLLEGGVSNRAVKVERSDGPPLVVKQALDRLRVSADWRCDPSRIHREALGLRLMPAIISAECAPAFVFEDEELHLLGMECIPAPCETWKSRLLEGRVEVPLARRFGRLLGCLHAAGEKRREIWPLELLDQSFFYALRVLPYYAHAAAQVPESAAFYSRLQKEMGGVRLTLVHGDFSPKNVLVIGDRMVLLDYEVIHVGDPAFDVGFAFTHLLAKALAFHGRTGPEDQYLAAGRACWEAYKEAAGGLLAHSDYEARAVRHTAGCLLARVEGKSPLEYLTPAQRTRQRQLALRLMDVPPLSMTSVFETFSRELSS